MVLTVSFALSSVTGLVCHRHQRNCLRELDASVGASGPHDFAVRKSAPSSEAQPASTASRPASVTIASRPSVGRDGGGYRSDLGVRRSGIFSQRGLDRKFSDLPVRQLGQPVRQQIVGWVEPFAKPIAVVGNMVGTASLHPSYALKKAGLQCRRAAWNH
jgi:hypothetical protein